MLAAQTILDKKEKKSFILFFHTRWLPFTRPTDALALESFCNALGKREGGDEKCQRKHVFKSLSFIQ